MSTKTRRTPKVTTKRAQRTLHDAANRNAENKASSDHIKNMLNGVTLLPKPNVKKVK